MIYSWGQSNAKFELPREASYYKTSSVLLSNLFIVKIYRWYFKYLFHEYTLTFVVLYSEVAFFVYFYFIMDKLNKVKSLVYVGYYFKVLNATNVM